MPARAVHRESGRTVEIIDSTRLGQKLLVRFPEPYTGRYVGPPERDRWVLASEVDRLPSHR